MKTMLVTIVLIMLSAITIFQEHAIHGLLDREVLQDQRTDELYIRQLEFNSEQRIKIIRALRELE